MSDLTKKQILLIGTTRMTDEIAELTGAPRANCEFRKAMHGSDPAKRPHEITLMQACDVIRDASLPELFIVFTYMCPPQIWMAIGASRRTIYVYEESSGRYTKCNLIQCER